MKRFLLISVVLFIVTIQSIIFWNLDHRLTKIEDNYIDYNNSLIFLKRDFKMTEELAKFNFHTARYSFYLANTLHIKNQDPASFITKEKMEAILNHRWVDFLKQTELKPEKDIYENLKIHKENKQLDKTIEFMKKHPDVFQNIDKFFGSKK